MIYEILDSNNNVVNTIVADSETILEKYPNGNYKLVPEQSIIIPEDFRKWWIDVGPFFDRFGSFKYAILSDTSPAVQALIKDCSVRKYIDLKRVDLESGLHLLVSAGHAVDVQAILTTPTTENERYIQGLV